jgi:cell division protein FtsB
MVAKIKKNKRDSKWFFPVFLGFLLIIIIVFLVISNFRIIQKRLKMDEEEKYLQEQLMIIEERSEELQFQAVQSVADDYLETEARERFNLKKPGEKVVTIIPSEEEGNENTERKWWNPFTW